MKELSIEEKAKRYDELKVTAQELEQDGCFDKITLFDLFPELKESDGEKIREALIDYFRWNPNSQLLNEFTNREVFDWLEKQGEQKPTWSVDDEELMKWSIINLTELKDRFGEEYGKVGDCIDWLKSIRPQNTWKPSDEQMNNKKYAIWKEKEVSK